MKINTRLRIVAAASLAVVLAYGTVALIIYQKLRIATQELAYADEIFHKIFNLKLITNDYLLYRTERAQQQWWSSFEDLDNLLNSKPRNFPILGRLTDVGEPLNQVRDNFKKLTEINSKVAVRPDEQDIRRELRNRTITQLLLNLQEIITKIFQLNSEIHDTVYTWQRWSTTLNLSSMILMLGIILVNSLLLAKAIVKPLLKLHEGAEIIGGGNLDYKVGINSQDEIGRLSRAFDQMTANLKNLTVSRDDLAQEIEQRRQAEDEIKSLAKFPAENPNPIVRVDQTGLILYANSSSKPLLGCWGSEIGQRLPDDWHNLILQSLSSGLTKEMEIACGEDIFSLELKPFGESGYVNIYGKNITKRKLAEEELRRSHGELEQRVKERTADLERANEAIQKSEENLRFLTSQVLAAQEEERRRISLELHDDLGQNLTVLKLHLRAVQRKLPKEEGPIQEDFEQALSQLSGMIENVRRISRDLSPSILENFGLQKALGLLVEEFEKFQGLQVVLRAEDIGGLFSFQDKANIYRIFQEALTNVAKHGQATRVSITIQKQDGLVSFSIEDNGVGFDLEEVSGRKITERGMGLASIEERMRMIGGKLNIRSKKGAGTSINFTVPFWAGQINI